MLPARNAEDLYHPANVKELSAGNWLHHNNRNTYPRFKWMGQSKSSDENRLTAKEISCVQCRSVDRAIAWFYAVQKTVAGNISIGYIIPCAQCRTRNVQKVVKNSHREDGWHRIFAWINEHVVLTCLFFEIKAATGADRRTSLVDNISFFLSWFTVTRNRSLLSLSIYCRPDKTSTLNRLSWFWKGRCLEKVVFCHSCSLP